MKMSESNKILLNFQNIVRRLAVYALYLIFVYWSAQALQKYYSEPTGTTIKHELGENAKGNTFPLVTFCNQDLSEQELILKEYCALEEVQGKHYQELVKNCFESNRELDMTLLMFHLQSYFKDSIQAILKTDAINAEEGYEITRKMWFNYWHPQYGFCDTLNLKSLKNDLVNRSNDNRWNDELTFYIWEFDKIVFFHDEDTLPNKVSNGYMVLKSDNDWTGYDVEIEKRIVSQMSLNRLPCASVDYSTCQDIQLHIKLIRGHGCWAPILYSGKHLDKYINKTLPVCEGSTILKVMKNVTDNLCRNIPKCRNTEYQLAVENLAPSISAKYKMSLTFGSQLVETSETSSSYDSHNLVGEIGGTLGLTLGGFGVYGLVIKYVTSQNWIGKTTLFGTWLIQWLCFVYFSSQDVALFISEPLSMTRTMNTEEFDFPMLTFCPFYDYYSDSLVDDELTSFYSKLEASLENGSNPNLIKEMIIDSNNHNIDDLIDIIHIKSGDDQYELTGEVWSSVYHDDKGLCYTLDIKKAENFKKPSKPITLSFSFKEASVQPFGTGMRDILIHTSEDLPSAADFSSTINFYPTIDWPTEYNIRKTRFLMQPTDHTPCGHLHLQVCREIQNYNIIKDRYGCHSPLLFTGNHLPIKNSLKSCNSTITLEALKLRSQNHKQCPALVPCQFTKFDFVTESNNWWLDSPRHPHLVIRMDNHIELYQLSFQYTIASLVGQIGGTMGIFLGWSIFLILELMTNLLKNKRFKITLNKFVVITPLLGLSGLWAKDTITMYFNEAETTQMQMKLGPLSLPSVTVCPYPEVKAFMDTNFPCGQDESEFMQTVKKCLLTEPDMIYKILNQFLNKGPKSLTLVTQLASFVMYEKDITTVFHDVLGPCYTFDTLQWENKIRACSFNYSLEACSNWKLEIRFKQSYKVHKIFVHNRNDFSEASFIHPNFNMYSGPDWYIEVALRKRVAIKQSTRSSPCQQYWPKTCYEIQRQKKIANEYNCEVGLFFSGKHLMSNGLPNCSNEVFMEILNKRYASNCSQLTPCEHTMYELVSEYEMRMPEQSEAVFSIVLKHDTEEHQHTGISVDRQSLLSQIGGISGITLGWCGMTLVEFICPILDQMFKVFALG